MLWNIHFLLFLVPTFPKQTSDGFSGGFFFFREVCNYVVDMFKTQRASAFNLISFQLGTLHNYHTSHLSLMVIAIFCGPKHPLKGEMHISSFRLCICTSTPSISSIGLQMFSLLVSASETAVAHSSLCFWFLSYPLLSTSSHSPSLFSFINSSARKLQMSS